MKNKNGVRYLDFISSVLSVTGLKVKGRGGRERGREVMEEYIWDKKADIERKRGEKVKNFHRLYSEING